MAGKHILRQQGVTLFSAPSKMAQRFSCWFGFALTPLPPAQKQGYHQENRRQHRIGYHQKNLPPRLPPPPKKATTNRRQNRMEANITSLSPSLRSCEGIAGAVLPRKGSAAHLDLFGCEPWRHPLVCLHGLSPHIRNPARAIKWYPKSPLLAHF